jgi:hypothetical protein
VGEPEEKAASREYRQGVGVVTRGHQAKGEETRLIVMEEEAKRVARHHPIQGSRDPGYRQWKE